MGIHLHLFNLLGECGVSLIGTKLWRRKIIVKEKILSLVQVNSIQVSTLQLKLSLEKNIYSKALRYMASTRTDLENACFCMLVQKNLKWYCGVKTLRGLSQITFTFFGIFWPCTPLVCTFYVVNYTFFWPLTHLKCKRNLWKTPKLHNWWSCFCIMALLSNSVYTNFDPKIFIFFRKHPNT